MDQPLVKITRDAIQQLLLTLGDDADEKLRLDMLEGETPLFDIIQIFLDAIEADEGTIAALDQQIMTRAERKVRAQMRIEQRKNIITSLMQSAGVKKVPLPEATVFISERAKSYKVVDTELLPEGFYTEETVRKPDREAITSAVELGKPPAGVTIPNNPPTLSVRRKG